jgi:hypothetical protein
VSASYYRDKKAILLLQHSLRAFSVKIVSTGTSPAFSEDFGGLPFLSIVNIYS